VSASTEHLLIPKIENGIVIDHIPAGSGVRILEILRADPKLSAAITTLGLNYSSRKLGRKDMIKLWVEELPPQVLQHISMICRGVTIKSIKRFGVEKKLFLSVPESIVGQARCKNPTCITNHERDVITRFFMTDPSSNEFKCAHCEQVAPLSELEIVVPWPDRRRKKRG